MFDFIISGIIVLPFLALGVFAAIDSFRADRDSK